MQNRTANALAVLAAKILEAANAYETQSPKGGWDSDDFTADLALAVYDEAAEDPLTVTEAEYRNAFIILRKAQEAVLEGYRDGKRKGEVDREMDAEACPGCGCLPGDGLTPNCNHPNGCGEARLQEASAHDLTMAGI